MSKQVIKTEFGIVERQDGVPDKLIYSYGFQCGTNNANPINPETDKVHMKGATVYIKADGTPVGDPVCDSQYNVDLSFAECDGKTLSEMLALRDDKILGKFNPVEEETE